MKIGLFSAHSFARPGGVQNHVIALYREFKKRGIEVKIIAPGHSHAMPAGVPESDVITIGVSAYIPANQSQAEFTMSVRRRFRQRIWRENFDILHFHNLGLGPLSYQIVRHSRSVHILTVHATVDGSTFTKLPPVKYFIKRFFELKFHGLIAVSPAAMTTIESFGGFSNGPVRMIPNGIDSEWFSPSALRGAKQNLLFVSRLEKRKGLSHLLRALKFLTDSGRMDLRLVVVGEGEQRKIAQNFVIRNNLAPYVFFAGNISDEALPDFYRNTDIFCAPATAGESFGMTLLEAMACGTPIVGFANPGYSFVMQGHEDACGVNLLAPSGDYIALAQKIALLVDNQEIYERARQWGLERVLEFVWPKIADQVLNFYKEAKEWQKNKQATDTRRM